MKDSIPAQQFLPLSPNNFRQGHLALPTTNALIVLRCSCKGTADASMPMACMQMAAEVAMLHQAWVKRSRSAHEGLRSQQLPTSARLPPEGPHSSTAAAFPVATSPQPLSATVPTSPLQHRGGGHSLASV